MLNIEIVSIKENDWEVDENYGEHNFQDNFDNIVVMVENFTIDMVKLLVLIVDYDKVVD